jgi:hypothetical protein
MSPRSSVLVQAAFVSAVVGVTAALIVVKCSGDRESALPPEGPVSQVELDQARVPVEPKPAPAPEAGVPPAPSAPPPPVQLTLNVVTPVDAGVSVGEAASPEPTRDAATELEQDAGEPVASEQDAGAPADAGAPPEIVVGAGKFLTVPAPFAASNWVSNPEAGAGEFTLDAPPFGASSWVSDPQAGAGPFITEGPRGGFFVPWYFAVPIR